MKERRNTVWLMLGLGLCLLPVVVSGQPVQNPTRATFEPSSDHALVTRYEAGYFFLGAAQPVQVATLGKPAPDAAGVVTVTLDTKPLALGQYELKVRAVAVIDTSMIVSVWARGINDAPVPFYSCPIPSGQPQTSAINWLRWQWFWEHCQ